MTQKVKLLKHIPYVADVVGIQMGEVLEVRSMGKSDQYKHRICYLVDGKNGFPIVLYDDEILEISA